jgi:lipoate-protein ligase A
VALSWRLLRHGPGVGEWNMGVDEALLATARLGVPSVRLYTWDGPWLSLGYSQGLEPARRLACERAGVRVVRRATGGRAVLHGCDLTYAVTAPIALVGGDVLESSARIARGLTKGLRSLGVDAVCAPPPRGRLRAAGFDCFATAGAHEVLSGGLKLCGSAQRRARGALLQHGSVRMSPEAPALRLAAGIDGGLATSLTELGLATPIETVEDALLEGLGSALEAEFRPSELTPGELGATRRRLALPPGAYPRRSQGAL